MANSEADICNTALAYVVAKQRIQSLNDGSEVSDLCALLYPSNRDELLALHPWHFARLHANLNQVSGVTRNGYSFVYNLPSDCLVPLEIWSGLKPPLLPSEKVPFDIEYGSSASLTYLLTDASPPAELIYTTKAIQPGRWPPYFDSALAWMLAEDLAMPLGGRTDIMQLTAREAKEKVSLARALDLNSRNPGPEPRSDYLRARE